MALPWLIGAIGVAAASAANLLSEEAQEKDGRAPRLPTDVEDLVDETFIELGRRVETARVLQRMTQDKCASAANISRTALRNLEDGKDAKLSTLWAVSNALSVPVTALFQGLQPEFEKDLLRHLDSQ